MKLTMEARQIVLKSQMLIGKQAFDQDITEKFLDSLEALDSFGFKIGVTLQERETYANQENVCQIIFASGNEQIIEYFYSANSDCNIKPMLI